MRKSHANPLPDAEFYVEEEQQTSSKTRRKAEMQTLQDLGERLVSMPVDRIKRTPLPDNLREAVMDARRFTQHGARRRQMQYIGRLMRDIDPAPIEAALAAFDGVSATENAKLHRLERERDALLEDEALITEIGSRHPNADLQRLRQLRRNALRERLENRPQKSYREIFQMLKALDAGSAGGAAPVFLQVVDDEDGAAADNASDASA